MELFRKISDNPSIVWINGEVVAERIDADYYHANHIQLNKSKIPMFKISTYCSLSKKRFNPNKYNKEYFKYIDISNVNNNTGVFEYQLVNINEAPSRARKKVSKNDIIISTVRPNRNAVAIINIEDDELVVSTGFAVIECKKNIDSYYLFAVLKTSNSIGQLVRKTSGGLYPAVSEQDVMEIEIPIPSPEIQKYIGDKVRKAEELREEAKTLQKEIDILLEVDMLLKEETDKVYNIYDSKINWTNEINIEDRIDPNFYQKKYISTIEKLGNNKVRLEKYVRITKIRYQTGNINKYIEISSINNSFGTIDEVEELRPEEIPTSAKYQVKEGDILVSLVRPTRKAISIVTKEYDNAICTGGFAVLQSKGKVPVEFLTAVLRTNFVGIQFERYCAGSTYPTINEDDVVKVFIPMYSENQINKITENYRRIIDNIYTSKKLIEEAKQDVEDLIEGNFDMSKVKANS